MPMPHMRRREGDEVVCPRCSLRWSFGEEPPTSECVDDKRNHMLATKGSIPISRNTTEHCGIVVTADEYFDPVLENIARAIWEAGERICTWDKANLEAKAIFYRYAKAAFEALFPPEKQVKPIEESDIWRVARAISIPQHHTTWDLLTEREKDLFYMQAEYAIGTINEIRSAQKN